MDEEDIAEITAAMNEPNQTPEQLQMRMVKVVLGAALRTPIATITSHPDVIGPYHAMCRRNGIKTPPDIIISPDYFGPPAAITREKAASLGFTTGPVILVGCTFDVYYEKEHRSAAMQGTLAHETVHILANDTESSPVIERRADRCAAQLLGDRQPLVTMVEGILAMPRLPHETEQTIALYGTPEDRLEQVKTIDVDDKAELKTLVAAYNERCDIERTPAK